MLSSPTKFEQLLISEYFKHGSINKVFYFHHFNLPISYAGYDRLLTKYKVVKSAGPNSKLTESLRILRLVADYKLSLEKIYEKYAPSRIHVSTNTLHRILHHIRLGLTRRHGVALLISSPNNSNEYLVGYDQSLSGNKLGNRGDLSLPMGHSKLGEDPKASITRVLQTEVFTNQTIIGKFPLNVVPKHPRPIMYINIADIHVAVYHLKLAKNLNFSSFKLHDLSFRNVAELKESRIRPGVEDIISNFIAQTDHIYAIPEYSSSLNTALFNLAKIEGK